MGITILIVIFNNGNIVFHTVDITTDYELVFDKIYLLFMIQRNVVVVTVVDSESLVVVGHHFFAICIDFITDMVKIFRLEDQSFYYCGENSNNL